MGFFKSPEDVALAGLTPERRELWRRKHEAESKSQERREHGPINLGAIDRLRFSPVRSYGIRRPVIPRLVRGDEPEKSKILAKRDVGFFREG